LAVAGDPKCKRCGLHESAQAVCLMGRGPSPAKVMLVGEAPGLREDDVGKPFQGASGKLLEKMISSAQEKYKRKIGRGKIYITNICKCRPPGNRTPKASEIKACKPFLEKEINEVKPKYVLLLGATALKGVLGKGKITEIHGQAIKKDGRWFMPTFHPSAALRDPKKADPIQSDIHEFFRMIKEGPRKYPPLNWVEVKNIDDLNECLEDIRSSEVISFDLETTGISRFEEESRVNIFAVATSNDNQWVISFMDKFKKEKVQQDIVELIVEASKGKKVIAHNGKFDNLWLRHKYGIRMPLTFDTMLAAHLLDENSPNGLKYLARMHFKAPSYDIDSKTKRGIFTAKHRGLRSKLLKYASMDVYYTLRLYYLFREKIKQDKYLLRLFKNLTMPISHVFEDVEEEGVYVDLKRMKEVGKQIEEGMEKEVKNLQKYINKEVNWNSPQQIAKVLFEDWKLGLEKKTPTGNFSTDESVLKDLEGQHPGIKYLLRYKKLFKQYSAFIKGWYKKMVGDRMYPSFKLHGTVTGRPSCAEPNLQQTPRDSIIRSLVGAPPGWDLVSADYSQIELRIAAMLSGEKTMKWSFQTGIDIHTKTASEIMSILPKDVTKEMRKRAKAVNFGFIYGMGAQGFQKYAKDKFEVEMSLSESKKYRRRYFELYSGLPSWHRRCKRVVKAYGQIRSLSGRLRRLPEIYSGDEGLRAQAERQAINTPVQGFAAELNLMGLLGISRRFSRDIVRPIGTVHDCILMLVKKGYLNKVLPEVKKIMESPPLLKKFKINITVPIEVEIEVGNWGVGKEWKKAN